MTDMTDQAGTFQAFDMTGRHPPLLPGWWDMGHGVQPEQRWVCVCGAGAVASHPSLASIRISTGGYYEVHKRRGYSRIEEDRRKI